MKKNMFVMMAIVALSLASCGNCKNDKAVENDSTTVVTDTVSVDSVATDTVAVDSVKA